MKQNSMKVARPLLILTLLALLAMTAISIAAQDDGIGNGELTAVPGGIEVESTYESGVEKEKSAPAPVKDPQAQAAAQTEAKGVAAGDLEAVSIIVTFDESVSPEALEAVSGGEVIYRYKEVFNGASLILAGDSVEKVAAVDGVTGIYLDKEVHLNTEVSPAFIGAPVFWNQLGGQENAGEGVVVGVLDTGIWPEHPSFSDPDPSGKPYLAPPGGPYECNFGNTAWNLNDAPFACNNKLIGAYEFMDTYKAVRGLTKEEFDSARDADGHGSHTASTAAGNGGVNASIFGVPRGTVSGIAPRAHVIMYRVCGGETGSCFSSDSVAAVEQAIVDGVDVINFSIGGGGDPYNDAVSLAFLSAFEKGIFVSASAGNSGPGADTTGHREPWTTTVAASTSDRQFLSTLTVEADTGDTLELEGVSITDGISTPTDVVLASDYGDGLCLSPFVPGTFSGEIVICERGIIARVAKSYNVGAGGANGLVLYNPSLQSLVSDNHFIPSVQIQNDAGQALLDFMAAHTGVTGTFTPGTATPGQGDVMASFSSRGGPAQTLGISKPDITAPGVSILAGHTPMPAFVGGGKPGEYFQAIAGTSMSSPHIAGSAALVKDAHPNWTPGQIKSALMMTATVDGVTKEDGVTPADAFDYGSGRVDLTRANNPGITISDTGVNFLALQDELWNANLPSLYIPVMPGKITVQRTLHSELSRNAVWKTVVDSPPDLKIVVPTTILVKDGQETTFDISLDASMVPLGETRFATLYLTYKGNTLRFPITIVRNQPAVLLEKSCDPLSAVQGETIDCIITLENTSFDDADFAVIDDVPPGLPIVNGSVVGADVIGASKLVYTGSLYGAAPPIVNVAIDPLASPAGYFPLSLFGITPISGVGDETIINLSTYPFEYAGETYVSIGMVSNGYAVVGGGTSADIDYVNTDLPDPAQPNNTLAAFWTDLNPSAGGDLRAAYLSDGVNTWLVLDWEGVPNFGDGELNDFQIWIGVDGYEDISYTYGPNISDGDGGRLTVGAENKYGNSGDTTYFDGAGDPPLPAGYEVDVFSTPGEPGESHTISFSMKASNLGPWVNCAEMTSNLFAGTSTSCISGEVEKK